jgi:thiamine pyrophosphokinase
MNDTALLVLNGRRCSFSLARELAANCTLVACVDGAYDWFRHSGVKIDFVSGDNDSRLSTIAADTAYLPTPDQEHTDFEKSLMIVARHYSQIKNIYVLGGTGREADHFLSNLVVMAKYGRAFRLLMLDDLHRIAYIEDKIITFTSHWQQPPAISLFAWPTVAFAASTGLQYPLNGLTFDSFSSASRNRATTARIQISKRSGAYILVVNDAPLQQLLKAKTLFLTAEAASDAAQAGR